MPVEISLLKNYQLRTKKKDPNVLELPAIELSPDISSNNIPHISSVNIAVRGKPDELANMIQLAYRRVQANNPFKLETPQRVKQNDCRVEEPSLPEVNCSLEVKVEYFDSDAAGNPNLGALREAIASCHMWWNASGVKPLKPEEEKPPENLESEPQDADESELERGEDISSSENKKDSQRSYPGWFAIDFGTSNSTVTLYEPKLIVPPDRLPKEQEKKLRSGLALWLNDRPRSAIPRVSGSDWDREWQKLISEVSKEFPDLDGQGNLGEQIFVQSNSARLLSAIRLVEIGIGNRQDWFRRAASKQLHAIYHEVFREPPLEWQSLIPVELDAVRKESEIPSELEITSLEPLNVLMGHWVRQERLQTKENIQGKFHHSPKRYLGQDRSITVSQNGTSQQLKVEQLIQTAFGHLIWLTEEYRDRNKDKCSQGHFNTAVVTYPAISPPRVRQQVKEKVSNLGIEHVEMAYDEAVSIAIFFLWREFGGDLNVGIESFKTRCRRYGDKWWQNVLVLDIGGGTTDLALIRLTLEEVYPFEANEDRGDGGRYYKLTPKLLGSSGHLQLGGELITLRIFQLLKAAIADCLLTAIATGELERDKLPDKLRGTLDTLNDRFLDNGQFQTGKLLACVDNENPEGDIAAYKDALDDAEKVLPTRWKEDAARQQTFYTLWQHAEDAKLKLGKKDQRKEGTEPIFVLSGQKIADLLAQNDMQWESENLDRLDSLSVTLTVAQFERAVTPAIKEAIGIAKGLMESSLTRKEKPSGQEVTDDLRQQEKLDWLILSGKTCNLYLVERELYQQFSKSDRFLWNPDKITFVPEYTKLATSAGACYAEVLRRLIFAPQDAKEVLRKGANQLYIDVKNLLYFLPCSFVLRTQNGFLPIFDAGAQLNLNESVAKVRSNEWKGAQLAISVYRKDFEDKQEQFWGNFNGEALATELGMTGPEFNKKINVQFEIDQELNISLLLCQGKPHYLIPTNLPSLDAAEAIKKPAVISEGKVVCDIAVNVAESAAAMRTDAEENVFNATKDYSKDLKVFRYEGDATQKKASGLISEPLPQFPLSGKHTFYFRDPDTHQWERIGELPQPGTQTEYPCEYRVTLDEKGILRIHAGEIPYWTDNSKECLKEEGCVYRTALELQPNDIEEKRDPFSGTH